MKTTKNNRWSRIAVAGVTLALLSSPLSSIAAEVTWDGSSSGAWNTSANWTPETSLTGNTVVYTAATSTGNLNNQTLGTSTSILGILFKDLASAVTIGSGNTLTLNGGGIDMSAASADLTIDSTVSLGDAQSWNVGSSRTLTVGGQVTGSKKLTKSGAGTLVLGNSANNYNGGLLISAGTLKIGSVKALSSDGLTFSGTGVLDLNGFSYTNNGINGSVNTATITDNSSGTGTSTFRYQSSIYTLSLLIKDGPTRKVAFELGNGDSPFSLSSTNTFSGGLLIDNNARLLLNGTITAGATPLGLGTITIGKTTTDKAQLFLTGGNNTVSNNIIVNASYYNEANSTGQFRTDSGTTTLAGTITANSDIEFCTLGSFDLKGLVTGSGGLRTTTNRTVTVKLSHSNDYSGLTRVCSNGTLRLGASDAIKAGNALTVDNGGKLDMATYGLTIGALNGGGTITNGAGGLSVDSGAFSGAIVGTGALTKSGSGTLTLSGVNTYTGNTMVKGGTLSVASGASLTNTAVTVTNAMLTNSGKIAGSITVQDAATMNGSGTYNGSVTIQSGGTLSGAGTYNSTVAVQSGGTLKGTSVHNGAVTVAGTHAPGNSPGLDTFTAGLTYDSTAVFEWEINVNDDTELLYRGQSTGWDAVDVTGGNLVVNSGATFKVVPLTGQDYADMFWDTDRDFLVFSESGSGSISGTFSLDSSATVTGEGTWSLAYGSDNITAHWAAIPEPATFGIMGSILAAAIIRRRRIG